MNYSKKKSTALNVIKKRKIKILLKEPKNNECFECSNFYPEYISLNNGIFLCQNCVREHFKLPKSISYIIKNNLRSLNLNNIQYLCCGGNQKLSEFINSEYPNLKKFSPKHLYQTYAMDYYRKMLNYLIEGGIKPEKPDLNKAYNLISINDEIMNNKNDIIIDIKYDKNQKRNINKIKSESYMKLNKNKYPKIKPIVGNKNLFRFNGGLSRPNNNLNLTVGNLNNSLENDFFNTTINNYNNYKLNSSTDFKQRNFSKFNKLYDSDDFNTTDNNELTEYSKKEKINDNSENLKLKNKNKTKIEINNNISTINNINLNRNNIYSKPINQNYLNTFQDNSNYYYNEYKDNSQINEKQPLINSIDNIRSYMSNKHKNKNNFIFDLKQRSHKKNILIDEYQKNKNININNFNNINNNIIINRNLNIIYNNNNSSHKIFKKKTIGNSFSINNKKHKLNKINNYFKEKRYLGNITGINNSVFNIKQRYNNNVWKNTGILTENNEMEKIKVNKQIKSIKNINSESDYINNITFTNEGEHHENSQKSKIIQRISRVLKTQKEREEKNEKIKKIEKIKVHQKEKNKITPPKERKVEDKKKEDKTPKGDNDDIKKDNLNKINSNKNKNSLSIKELINTPFGKKRNILDIIKSNNLSNKLVSPNSKNIYQISTDPKRINKKEISSLREKYKRKKEN